MGDSAANASGQPPKGRAKACTACRQVKLKCDAKEVYPQPCTRCKQQSLECKMDPTFKRVPARRQLEEVSNRLANLQKSLGLDQSSTFSGTPIEAPQLARIEGRRPSPGQQPPDFRPRRPSGVSSGPSSPDDHPSPQYSKFLDLLDENEQGTWTLGDLTLRYDQLLPLFRHFDKCLWRHVPILEPCHSLNDLYQSSNLLFWTIVLVSARLYNHYDSLYLQLVPRHRTLLSMTLLGQRNSLLTVQAILILCTWPYPVSSQYDDITWMLCGAAINMAMMLGLHKPLHTHEYGHEYERIPGPAYVRHVTWLALFTLTTSVGSWLGMPPPLCTAQHFETIDDLCRDDRLPKSFRAEAAIQRQVAQFSTALDSKIDFRTRFSLIKIYEHEVDRVRTSFSDAWSDDLEISWLATKIFLVGMAFISNGESSTQHESESRAIAAREMLQHGLSASSRLLSTISKMRLPHTSTGENKTGVSDYIYQLSFYPKQTFRVAAFANFYLLWYLAVDAQASNTDKDMAKTWVTFTYRLLGAFKHSPEHIRAAKGIELMAHIGPSEHNAKPNQLAVNSRLGASIMYSYNFRDCTQPATTSKILELPNPEAQSAEVQKPLTPLAPSEETVTTPDSENSHRIRLDNLSIGYGRDTTSSPEAISTQPSTQAQGTPLQAKNSRLPPGQLPLPTGDFSSVFSNAFFQDTTNQDFDFLWEQWDPAVFDDLKMDVDTNSMPVSDATQEAGYVQ